MGLGFELRKYGSQANALVPDHTASLLPSGVIWERFRDKFILELKAKL